MHSWVNKQINNKQASKHDLSLPLPGVSGQPWYNVALMITK